jgi:hypothetical protein
MKSYRIYRIGSEFAGQHLMDCEAKSKLAALVYYHRINGLNVRVSCNECMEGPDVDEAGGFDVFEVRELRNFPVGLP